MKLQDDPARVWPASSLEEIEARLCAPGERFEIDIVTINGVPTRTWKNAPPNLPALARFARKEHGTRVFMKMDEERVTYDAWFRATATLAAELARLNVVKGDRVALVMRNLPEWPVAFFAITALGAIVVPLNAWWTGSELEHALAHSGCKALICDPERWDRIAPHLAALPALEHAFVSAGCSTLNSPARPLEEIIGKSDAWETLPDTDLPDAAILPDDEATIFYTSGTTGKPKGAVGSHRNILSNILSGAYSALRAVLRRGDEPPTSVLPKVGLTVIPLFHVTACGAG